MEITTSTNAFLKLILFQFSPRCANSVWCIENKYLSSNEDLFAGLTLWVTTRRRGLQAFMSLQVSGVSVHEWSKPPYWPPYSKVSVHEWWQATPCWPTDPILFAIALPFQVSRCEIHFKSLHTTRCPRVIAPLLTYRPNLIRGQTSLIEFASSSFVNADMPYSQFGRTKWTKY